MNTVYPIEPHIDKIAVLRANALGDFIFALPALQALRDTYPRAEIVLLAREWHHAFLSHRPSPIDRVVPIPKGGIGTEEAIGQDPAELAAFFQAMQAEKFDLAIQMHGGGRNSNPFTLGLKARLTIGACTPDAAKLDRWIPYIHYQPEVMRYLEMVGLVGARTTHWVPYLQVTDRDRQESYPVVPATSQPLVALHPGATDPRRRWPPEKFAELGDALAAQGMQVVVTGTPPEQDLVEAVIRHMRQPAQNLCGQLSLAGLVGLLDRCQLMISNDSGPLHVAIAVGTPTVGIYWCGNVITAAPLMRTSFYPAISWRLNCVICGADCTQNSCEHRASYVADVTVQEVLTAAAQLSTLRRVSQGTVAPMLDRSSNPVGS